MSNKQSTGYLTFINENKDEIIKKLKIEREEDKLYGYEILNILSREWSNLPYEIKEIYKNIAKAINDEPEWLKNAENILNKQLNMTLNVRYKDLYGL